MSPARKRAAVNALQAKFTVSERRACRVIDQPRSSQRYASPPRDDEPALLQRMPERPSYEELIAAVDPAFLFRRRFKRDLMITPGSYEQEPVLEVQRGSLVEKSLAQRRVPGKAAPATDVPAVIR